MQTIIGPVGSNDMLSTDPQVATLRSYVNNIDALCNSSISSSEYYPARYESKLDVGEDIILKNESLSERLERIEAVLHIPIRNVEMEKKHSRLKQLFEEYMYELEKLKTWEKLND